MEKMKKFPARHISSTEDLRVLLNEYLDHCVTFEEYNKVLDELTNVKDMYEGLQGHCEDLEEQLRLKDEEIAELRKPQEKKTLKKLDKKPLKRLK